MCERRGEFFFLLFLRVQLCVEVLPAYLLARQMFHDELFDYKSWILGTGDSSSLATHMVTLVRIRHEGRWIYSVLDAYFNVAFVTSTGQPLDYSQLVLHLVNRQHDAMFLHSIDFCQFQHLVSTRSRKRRRLWLVLLILIGRSWRITTRSNNYQMGSINLYLLDR